MITVRHQLFVYDQKIGEIHLRQTTLVTPQLLETFVNGGAFKIQGFHETIQFNIFKYLSIPNKASYEHMKIYESERGTFLKQPLKFCVTLAQTDQFDWIIVR